MNLKLQYTIIALGSFLMMQGQTKEARALTYFEDFKFDKAIELYSEIAQKRTDEEILQKLADSYFNIGNYTQAKDWYAKLYLLKGKDVGENNIIKLVQCLKAGNDIQRADEVLLSFYKDKDRLDMILAQQKNLDSLLLEEPAFAIKNVPFNSRKSDFSPAFYRDNKLVFSSTRDSIKAGGKIYPWNNQPYLDLFVTNTMFDEFVPEKFVQGLLSDYHDASVVFGKDMETVYVTRNYLKKGKLKTNNEGLSNMQIVRAEIFNGELVNSTSLSFNNIEYSCGHPAISTDGKYLYFTSNMPGGYGDSDIYVVSLSTTGEVTSPPMNLGPSVNTKGREMFPYVVNDVLYFASDGHYGTGGLDLFKSKIFSKDEYSIPLNMGAPFNSNMDDFSLIKDPVTNTGYFASNRMGGMGDDDIYYFEKVAPTDCLVYSGYVLNETTNEPIANANVELKNPEDGLIEILKTDEKGYYELSLPCNRRNRMVFSKQRFSEKTVFVATTENPESDSENNIVYLTPYDSLIVKEGDVEKIKVDPIYFDYDKSDITARAEIELEKVLFAMNEFPDIKIKIESHTDSRGSDDYNLKLSDARAKSTRDYLFSKGIALDRIESAIGYGETQLKNKCKNGVKCSEQEHLINRRSDFIILKKKQDELVKQTFD